jgi:hypothetical protein
MDQDWNLVRPLVSYRLREGSFAVLAALMAALLVSCSNHGGGTTGHVALRLTATSSGRSISGSASVDGGTGRPADLIYRSGTTLFSMDFDIADSVRATKVLALAAFALQTFQQTSPHRDARVTSSPSV